MNLRPTSTGWLRRAALAGAVVAAAVGLALVWTFPLLQAPASHVLGAGAGDNVTFLWNVWWMRRAIADPALEFFFCPLIFAPWGTSLVLHTHTALPALAGATLLGPLPLALAQNVLIWTALAANTCAMFALALDRIRDRQAAFVAALVFGGSPFLAAHLQGHWNLIHLWPLPLVMLAAGRAMAGSQTIAWAVVAGGALGAAVYIDYYIALYAAALFTLVIADRLVTVTLLVRHPRWTLLSGALVAVAVLAFGVALLIVWSGGTTLPIGGIQISARTMTNPLRTAWTALILAGITLWRPRLRFDWNDVRPRTARSPQELADLPPSMSGTREHRPRGQRALVTVCLSALVCAAAVSPLLSHAFDLIASGDYAGEVSRWRSGPRGIDLVTLVLGNPYHPLYGEKVRATYAELGLDAIEQVGWMGIAPLVLAVIAVRQSRARSLKWAILAGGAVVWAFGPFLMVAGVDVGLPLPQLLQRFVPVVSNARIPGRAMAVGFLALGMLAGLGTATLRRRLRQRNAGIATGVIALAVLIDFWPAPMPVISLEVPALYEKVATLGTGPVAELPMGIRDGFGQHGRLDHRVLVHQTVHGRPIAGGFVARLSPELRSRVLKEPVIGSLVKLSAGASLSVDEIERDRRLGPERLRQWGLRVFVVDNRQASRALVDYLEQVLEARHQFGDGEREVYLVTAM